MAIDDGRRVDGASGAPPRFSASEAAFTGLRLITREPRTWLIWGALVLAFSLVMGALSVVIAGSAMTELTAMRTSQPDPAAQLALMGRLAPLYGVILPASLVFYAVAFAAVNRAVLRPAPSRVAHLAFGGDELRQFIVLILLFAALIGVEIAGVVVGVILAAVVIAILTAAHAGAAAAVLIGVAVGLLVVAAIFFVMTRLSLASPLAMDTGRIDLGASWRMTRGRVWPLFGTYLLTWLVTAAIFLTAIVLFAVVAVATGGGLSAASVLFRPDMSSLPAYFAPLQVLWLVINAALAPVLFALSLGAPAGAYAQLRSLAAPALAEPVADLPRFGR